MKKHGRHISNFTIFILIGTLTSCSIKPHKLNVSFKKNTTRSIANTTLSCKNLFKAQRLVVAKNNIIDYIKHPRKFILKDSQRNNKQQQTYFQFQRHPFKIQFHPFKWIDKQVLIRPTRYLTSKLLKNEYEPSMLFSFALYTYFFIAVIAPVTIEPMMEQNAELYQDQEQDFALENDYRYENFNKGLILLNDLKKKEVKSKEDLKLMENIENALLQVPAVFKSYSLYFFTLLDYKNQLIEKKISTPEQDLISIQNLGEKLNLKKEVKTNDVVTNTQSAEPIKCSLCHLLPIDLFSLMLKDTPHVFLDWAQYAEKTSELPEKGFKKLEPKKIFNQKDYLTKLLFRMHKKILDQEIVFRHLYKNSYNLHDTIVWMNTSTGFDEIQNTFPTETKKLLNSSMYKDLQALFLEKKITKKVFLKAMQEFLQWKFNLETWKSLGLQRVASYKKKGKTIEVVITLEKTQKEMLRSLVKSSNKK